MVARDDASASRSSASAVSARRDGRGTPETTSNSAQGVRTIALRDERRPFGGGSEPQRGADGNHGRASGVHGLDDLAAIDPLQVDAGDAEVAVPELALDDD